jgi:hypothetical protein
MAPSLLLAPYIFKSQCGEVAGSQPISTTVHNAHGAQMNFGDPYLTYVAPYLEI